MSNACKESNRRCCDLGAQSYRVIFRDHGDYLKIERVLDRKEAYR